jgi:serine/threonine-protein kinase
MPPKPAKSAGHADRLDEAVTGYLEAVEAGRTPSRDDWLSRYRDVAAELAEFFADQDRVECRTANLRAIAKAVASASPSPLQLHPGGAGAIHAMGDYELLEVIGQGGMGVVFRARQKGLNRVVALKMIRAGQLASATEVQRFRKEAEATAHLDHLHIVPVYEVGEDRDQLYFTMKLIEGASLAQEVAAGQWLGGGQDAQRRAAGLMAAIARAVHH